MDFMDKDKDKHKHKPRYYLAIDIGASSGRHIVGWYDDAGRQTGDSGLHTREVYRFHNGVANEDGHLVWDIDALVTEVKKGIDAALEEYPDIVSLSVDTWGVDYVLMNGDKEIYPCYAYRDDRTQSVIPEVHARMAFSELYRRTGIQHQPFNTLYQLYSDQISGRLAQATDCLMIPEYLMYKLCGVKVHEYTNATTGGMVSADTGSFDRDIIETMGLPVHLFGELLKPGTVIGVYRGIKVMLCASHDTASAVEGIPMDGYYPYISSGTWSLLGVKTDRPLTDENSMAANWSNEGGIGYNRYQKNIMGMWLVNRLREELCPDMPFDEIVSAAEASGYTETVDADDGIFLAPDSMKAAFDARLKSKPAEPGDYFACAYRSLAISYGKAIRELETNTHTAYDRIYIVGGGARNTFLNRLTEEATGKRVIALPIEATAAGNLSVQSRYDKEDMS